MPEQEQSATSRKELGIRLLAYSIGATGLTLTVSWFVDLWNAVIA